MISYDKNRVYAVSPYLISDVGLDSALLYMYLYSYNKHELITIDTQKIMDDLGFDEPTITKLLVRMSRIELLTYDRVKEDELEIRLNPIEKYVDIYCDEYLSKCTKEYDNQD